MIESEVGANYVKIYEVEVNGGEVKWVELNEGEVNRA